MRKISEKSNQDLPQVTERLPRNYSLFSDATLADPSVAASKDVARTVITFIGSFDLTFVTAFPEKR